MIDLKRDFDLEDVVLVNFVNLADKEKEMVRKWRNSEAVRSSMYSDHIISQDEHFKFIEKLKLDAENFYWFVKCKGKGSLGVIYLNRVDFDNKNAYLGIYKNPSCEISGIGHILIGCLKKLAFEIVKLHTLKLEVIEDNKRALDFYKKIGFKEEGRLKEFVLKAGKLHDAIVMAVMNKVCEEKNEV